MKKYILISFILTVFTFTISYADISVSTKQKIESRIDNVIEKIENKVSNINEFNKKKDYLHDLLLKVDRLEKRYASRSQTYEYLFNYLSDELNEIYAQLNNWEVIYDPNYYWAWLSGVQIRNIVYTHNIYRSQVWVDELEWSDTVAKSAEKWWKVLKERWCWFTHSSREFRNKYWENLYTYWSSDKNFSWDNSESAIKALWDEKFDYDYDSNTCKSWKVCGHYTQIVWKNTTQVWCARIECRDDWYQEVLICQYNPAGNYIWQKPY